MKVVVDLLDARFWTFDIGAEIYSWVSDLAEHENIKFLAAESNANCGHALLEAMAPGSALELWPISEFDDPSTFKTAQIHLHTAVIGWSMPSAYIVVLPVEHENEAVSFLPDFREIPCKSYIYIPDDLLFHHRTSICNILESISDDVVVLCDHQKSVLSLTEVAGDGCSQQYGVLSDTIVDLLANDTLSNTIKVDAQQREEKPTMAYLSPFPPEQSGIADYSAEILPALSHYYRITLVSDSLPHIDQTLCNNYPVISFDTFAEEGNHYDRVLYHFGNSSFHAKYFDLIRTISGVSILHDVYLAHGIAAISPDKNHLRAHQEAYVTHGWGAALDFNKDIQQALWTYPSFGSVFSCSRGVIVHSRHARNIISHYLGHEQKDRTTIVPLAREPRDLPDRMKARKTLKIPENRLVVATFGVVSEGKAIEILMDAWRETQLAGNQSAMLVCVGGFGSAPYAKLIKARLKSETKLENVTVTGRVSREQYENYLAAADVAVQLRKNSRGETSAATLDCLMAGLPCISNSHGSQAELPGEAVYLLPDNFEVDKLVMALSELANDSSLRLKIGDAARNYVAQKRTPERTALQYFRAIETFYKNDPLAIRDKLLHALMGAGCLDGGPGELQCLSEWIAAIESKLVPQLSFIHGRKLLVDVSAMVQVDLRSGIQRVVRNVLVNLLERAPRGYRVEPIYFDGTRFRYARDFAQKLLNLPSLEIEGDEVEVFSNDVFLALDLYWPIVNSDISFGILSGWRQRGVSINFVVYDMLPIRFPECFPDEAIADYSKWLERVSTVANIMVCISRSVASEVRQWLSQRREEQMCPRVSYFYLGGELEVIQDCEFSELENECYRDIYQRPYMLMVGTVEPRKGHAQVVDAFELLWSRGEDMQLVIVGKKGWMVDYIANRMRELGRQQPKFKWIENASDALLRKLYGTATCVIVASYGEGFGLPLIEAAHYDVPVICRNIPVFREVAGEHAYYFDTLEGGVLADVIEDWKHFNRYGYAPSSRGMRAITWRNSAKQLMAAII